MKSRLTRCKDNRVIAETYQNHIATLQISYEKAITHVAASHQLDGLLIHSGSEHYYFDDDRGIAFQAFGHFLHWIDVNRPDQLLLIRPGETPIYFQVIPDDFWYEQAIASEPVWGECFKVVRVNSLSEVAKALPSGQFAYLGESSSLAGAMNIAEANCNPKPLCSYLDYYRAYKTEYELDQLRTANQLALNGHQAARDCFLAGGSEYDIHLAYLGTCGVLEDETPYTNIVALDDKSAILHYQNKRRQLAQTSQVLLIDAGYRVRSYGSDITRTWVRDGVHASFAELLVGMEAIKDRLVAQVRPGISYIDIHRQALLQITELLLRLEICHGEAPDLLEREITQLFMPHGVGHLLGIQVHDVGGHQLNHDGETLAPPAHSPMLRNTRDLAADMVFTIEPGCYFIPLLLEPQRSGENHHRFNWDLIDQLYPLGGIRVEDNVRVTQSGVENLTPGTS